MGLRKLINRVIDWAADQVQTSTGEKERREEVACLKQLALDFKLKVAEAILRLNESISSFNKSVSHLNAVRNTHVKENMDALYVFLKKFGNCKAPDAYAPENQKLPAEFPQQTLDSIDNYIANVDWSDDDVFLNTFLLSPLGMKLKTRKQNLALHEHIQELQLLTEETLNQLEIKKLSTELEIRICNLYAKNVEFISDFITAKIIPELQLVEAFFQAEKLKNEVIAGYIPSKEIVFSYNIKGIEGSDYLRHYQFVKNAVAFYVLSCCIYSTPVLTNLLNSNVSESDIMRLEQENTVLHQQSDKLLLSAIANGGNL